LPEKEYKKGKNGRKTLKEIWHFGAIGSFLCVHYDFFNSDAWICSGRSVSRLAILEVKAVSEKRSPVAKLLQHLWQDEQGQDIAEYAVMLAVILVIVVGTVRLIGSNANTVFSQVGSAIQ
jgi:pilus assembly protein Flp/PilA